MLKPISALLVVIPMVLSVSACKDAKLDTDDQKVSYLVTVAINVRLNWLDAWASSMK